jgi:hypothetical protein
MSAHHSTAAQKRTSLKVADGPETDFIDFPRQIQASIAPSG